MKLIHLEYSPWSEKVRWVLDHQNISYKKYAYLPMLGEPFLRLATRRLMGQVTVPVLLDGMNTIFDSLEIVRYIDQKGSGKFLVPLKDSIQIETWNDLSESALQSARALVTCRFFSNPKAKQESLPPLIPKFAKPAFEPIATGVLYFLRWKYDFKEQILLIYENKIRKVLKQLRKALTTSSPYLLGEFSYADIVMAVTLQAVRLVEDKYIPLGPNARDCWTTPTLREEFADLIEWRDELYRKHR